MPSLREACLGSGSGSMTQQQRLLQQECRLAPSKAHTRKPLVAIRRYGCLSTHTKDVLVGVVRAWGPRQSFGSRRSCTGGRKPQACRPEAIFPPVLLREGQGLPLTPQLDDATRGFTATARPPAAYSPPLYLPAVLLTLAPLPSLASTTPRPRLQSQLQAPTSPSLFQPCLTPSSPVN